MMKQFVRVCALCSCLAAHLAAQLITGSIVGTVQDSSQAFVPGAQVQLLHRSTGRVRTVETDSLGAFSAGGLDAGEYQITVAKEGFKRVVSKNVHLATGERMPAGVFTLEIGTVTETVLVSARAASVQTESAERADVVTGDQADKLLTIGRSVVSLVGLLPGVVDRTNNESPSVSMDLHVLGNRQRANNVAVDGAPVIDVDSGTGMRLHVSQDAVAEVKILVSNYQAEYGRMAGSNIQVVTKSGTRDFHGLGSYFKRHEQFNANNFFNNRVGIQRPRYRYNTWTYNLGGPVYLPGKFTRNKDKLFFFWQQEFWPVSSGRTGNVTVPTELERRGDFSKSLDLDGKVTAIRDPAAGAVFPGNVIPASRLDASGLALLKLLPLPNFLDRTVSGGQFNHVYTADQNAPQHTETLKIDYNINPRHSLVWSYSAYYNNQDGVGITAVPSNWPQFLMGYKAPAKTASARHTWVASPATVNEFQFAVMWQTEKNNYTDAELARNQRDKVGFTAGQFTPSINPLGLIPNATFGGVTNAVNLNIDGRFPYDNRLGVMTLDEKFTHTRAGHTLKGGVYVERYYRDMVVQSLLPNGSIDFGRNANNPLETNYAFANAALGVFNSYSEASARPKMLARALVSEFFVQDNWKAHRRLTLDYGVRMYWAPPIADADDQMTGFVPGRYTPPKAVRLISPGLDARGTRIGVSPVNGAQYPATLIGAIAPGAGDTANGMVQVAVDKSYPRALTANPGLQFGPRVGLAWDVFGNARTAVRGGFGIFYNRESMAEAYKWLIAQPPTVNTPVVNYGQLSTLRSSTGLLFPSAALARDPESKLQQTLNFSLSVQQDVWRGTLVDVGYVGSLGRHLVWRRPINVIPAGANFDPKNGDATQAGRPLAPAFLRPIAGYNDIDMIEPAGTSNYHSLQVSARRRFTDKLQFGAAWTWSKTMGFAESEQNVISAIVPVRVWNYGMLSWDRTHVFKVNFLYDLPKFGPEHPGARLILRGWQLSGITSLSSGAPLGIGFSQTVATDITGTSSQSARIVVTGDAVLPKSERTFSRNFRTDVFQVPQRGTFGNAASTLIRGPGGNNWDIAFFKTVPVAERFKVQFRCEMYNAFNHTQFSALDTTARFDPQGRQVNSQFGQFTAASRARYIQMALRLTF
jgi:hypothetical protein